MGRIVSESAARLLNYTCTEPVERRYYRAKLAGSLRICDDLSAEKKKRGYKLVLENTDRLRLHVRAGAMGEATLPISLSREKLKVAAASCSHILFACPRSGAIFRSACRRAARSPKATRGTVFADSDTAEPVRLTTRTAELPSEAFCCEMSSTFEYRRMRIGASEFLLSLEARQRFGERSSVETENVTTFGMPGTG
jgi:hypothetical protein